jgi:hypothetical protein
MKGPQTSLNSSLVIAEETQIRPVKLLIAAANAAGKWSVDMPNLSEPATFSRLLDCLTLYDQN